MITKLTSLAAAALFITAAAGATDDPDDPCRGKKWAAYQGQGENDVLVASDATDESYTNGLLYSQLYNPDCNPPWAERFGKRLRGWLFPGSRADVALGWEVGQHLFTPTDLEREELIEDDRPYAAWLYGGLFYVLTATESKRQQTLELQFGLVGPAALGEEVQEGVHELISSQLPRGWDNQIPNEPGVSLIYLWRQRFGGGTADIVPHLGGALGTIQIYANAGLTLRLGKNISGFPVLQNRMTAAEPEVSRKRRRWEAYLFAGADARALAHNIFLDGTVFRDSHSVDKESFVYDLKAGFSARYKSFRFTYTFVRRSKEFSPLPAGVGGDGEHEFGSLSVGVEKAF